MDHDLPTGVRRLKKSYQAYLEHAGKFYSQTFPFSTPLSTMKEWRERTRANLKYGTPAEAVRTFAEDADAYLKLCTALPSYAVKKYHIDQWALAFGSSDRATITAAQIRLQLETWRKKGRYDGKALSVASLNRRRTDLMAMFTALDGRSQPNIVKDVPRYDERGSIRNRAQPMLVMAQIIRHLRPWWLTRLRCHVLMWTGWPSSLVKQVQAADIDEQAGTIDVSRRLKGKGMEAATIPVHRRAMLAFVALRDRGGLGTFSNSSLHSAWSRAVAAENRRRKALKLHPLPALRVYDLKHSFGTWAAPRVKDDRALKELMRTNSIDRYIQGAKLERLRQAVVLLEPSRRVSL